MLLHDFIDRHFVTRPHRFVPAAMFCVILLYFLTNFHDPIYTRALGDPDDYMRLNEVINWLGGQGWYDLSQPRLSPGAHTVINWARLLDIPLALLMQPFLKVWGMRDAAMIAALIEPLLLLILLLMLVPRMARPLVGSSRAKLAVLFIPFIGSLFFNFSPGRVDHHNWEILIAGLGLLALQGMLLCRGGWKTGIAAASAYAIGLWISPEIMPALILTLGCLALFAAWRGGFALRNAAIFGSALAVAAAACLPADLPVSEWNSLTISWFSPAYVIFAALAGAPFIVTWLLGRRTSNRLLRMALMLALCGFAALVFVYLVPDALNGPFADFDAFDATTALDNIGEAKPLIAGLKANPYNHLTWLAVVINYLHFLLPETFALLLCAWGFATSTSRRRMLWAVNGLCLGGTMAMGLFLQYRVLWFGQIFQLGPMAFLVWCLWEKVGGNWTRWQKIRAALVTFLVMTQVPIFAHMLMPMDAPHGTCALRPAAESLAGLRNNAGQPLTILAGANEGPELLFRTPHNVLAGNFNVPANKDVLDFFASRSDDKALPILRKWHVDHVLTCRSIPPFYAGMEHLRIGKNAFLKAGADGRLRFVSSSAHPSLAERLVNGQTPDWLKPVEIPGLKDYLLFEVRDPASATNPP